MGQYGGIIGGVVGAVVGFFAGGNVYAGWMIGSAIGGAYSASQQVIPGPKLGDIQQQTAQEGTPRPIVFGRSHPIAGNIIADGGPRKVTRRERQGKGGPKVETESVYRTYAVAFCEGPVRAFLQVWRNNTLVYDIEDPSMSAENAEFLKYARFFLGSYNQMPSPDLESVLGAGNVTAHRGTAYMVLRDEDLTDLRGMWSQWKVRIDAQEPDAYLTSQPYAQFFKDSASVGFRPRAGGTLRTMLKDGSLDPDNVALGFVPNGGELFDVPPQKIEPDLLELSFYPTGGKLSAPPVGNLDPDAVQLGFAPSGGRMGNSPLGTISPDNVSMTFVPTGGTLNAP